MNLVVFGAAGFAVIGLLVLKRASLVPARQACDLLRKGALILDVRTAGEFKSGHLPRAVNVPLDRLADEVLTVAPDKNRVLLLHCLSGTRSGIARHQLKRMGYTSVFNLGSYARAEKLLRESAPAST